MHLVDARARAVVLTHGVCRARSTQRVKVLGERVGCDSGVRQEPAQERRGEALHALGRMPEAEAAGRKALALDPLSAVINNALSYVYLGRPDNDEAIRFWRRAVALEPDAHV